MKTLTNLLALVILAANIAACGMVDEEPQDEPVVINTNELEDTQSQFEGVYQGRSTKVFMYTFGGDEYDGSDIAETQVTITPSKHGGLLLTGAFGGNCPFRATDHGDWIEVDSNCTIPETIDGIRARATYHLEGEGEFTKSGKLSLELHGTSQFEFEVHYDSGPRWEKNGSGELTIDFSGRAL